MLDPMTKRLRTQRTVEAAVAQILDDGMALNGAEYGTFQLPMGDSLLLVEHRGFTSHFSTCFAR
jgi:hypothetical protein